MMTPEQKIDIVLRMMKTWKDRPNDTMDQIWPGMNWPENIRNCNMHEFLTVVYNDNPVAAKIAALDANASVDTYVEAVVRSVSNGATGTDF